MLLRESYREEGKVKKRTIANLTKMPSELIDILRMALKEGKLVPACDTYTIRKSQPHGHVRAVLGVLKNLGLDTIISSRPCKERDLVVAMIAQRLLHPSSKLASTGLFNSTTLAQELDVSDTDVDDLYKAMDWLLSRKERIENKLAKRHLFDGSQVLYDVSSSYYEGHCCLLAQFGKNRDGKEGKLIIVYGLLTDREGRPVAVDVYPGNTADPTTVPDQVEKLVKRFKLDRVVLTGDRGMLTGAQIDKLKERPQLGWISALRSSDIRKLVAGGEFQPSLFDEHDLLEIQSDEFPGERLVACFNPLLADERARKRNSLLEATEKHLRKIERQVARRTRTPLTESEISLKVGRVYNKHKMAKHFKLTIAKGVFRWERDQENIDRESALDGIYIIRTSESGDNLSAEDAVRAYKRLALTERCFRTMKSLEIMIRPIYHHVDDRVRAHIFLCMLACYVEWHMREALKPLLFDDEELFVERLVRHPVAPAEPSRSARAKKASRTTTDGHPVHSFDTLMQELATLGRHECLVKGQHTQGTFIQHTEPTDLQAQAFQLLDV